MKKSALLILIALSTLDLFSQIEKGKIIFSIDGNYMQSTTENGVTSNQNVVKGKYLSVGSSVGYFITDRFIGGFGLDYNSGKEVRTTKMLINRFYQVEEMNTKSYVWLLNFYLGYYYQIIDKLYINTNLKFNYGKVKSEYKSLMAGSARNLEPFITQNDPYLQSYLYKWEKSSKVDFFSAEILPELTYFLSPNFSLSLGLGGLGYSLIDWKNESSNWIVNFNPTYWKFGIRIGI